MKNVACYCRVSTEEQVKYGFSIQAQKDALEKYCKDNEYKYTFYIDEGISASSMTKRKALNEMLSKSNVFDLILFTKLDRLSRNVLDANNINKILQENNCTMKAIDEDDVDTSTADGMFMFNLKVSLAQREIGKTSERINFVFNNKREKGEVTSGTKKYGYDIVDKHYIINEAEAENLKNLYNFFVSVNGNMAETYKYFIKYFNGKGYNALSKYLRDTSYIGQYKLYRKDIYIDNYIPKIIPEDLFQNVQVLLKKKQNSLSSNNQISLFTGLIYCTECNSRMNKKQDNRVHNILIRYCCDNSFRHKVGSIEKKCTNNTTIREDTIEDYLLTNLKEEAKKFIIKNSAKNIENKIDNTSKINALENKLLKLKDLYIDDLIDKDTYRKDYQKYNSELSKLKENIAVAKPKDLTNVNKILNSDIITIYSNLSRENKRKFWLSIIDKIYVEKGEIKEVTFL